MAKKVVTISLENSLCKRIDAIARSQDISRSSCIERLCRDGVEQTEFMVKAMSDPLLSKAFSQAFSTPGVVTSMVDAIGEKLNPSQLELFQMSLENAVKKSEKSIARKRKGRVRVKGKNA